MKLKELSSVLYSTHGNIQFAIVYDITNHVEIMKGCSIDYAVKNFEDKKVRHITADGNYLVITIES